MQALLSSLRRTMFMHAMLIFYVILSDFSYTVQPDTDVIVLYEGNYVYA